MVLFDRYVVVDWSANSTPKRGADSIWVSVHDGSAAATVNHATRAAAIEHLAELSGPVGDRRTLLGIDVSLGYPRGTASALGLAGTPWAAMWGLLAQEIHDDERNANNRFVAASRLNERMGSPPGPFWGCPPAVGDAALTVTKPTHAELPVWRHVEDRLRATGHRPHSSWQLLGAGSVGGQSLLAIARLEQLRTTARGTVHVWPFATGLTVPECGPGDVVIAEVWPTLAPGGVAGGDRVRDEAQVEDTAAWLAALDRSGRLPRLFCPELDPDVQRVVVGEEGWVLGVSGSCEPTDGHRGVPDA